jgi:hypothetical protein
MKEEIFEVAYQSNDGEPIVRTIKVLALNPDQARKKVKDVMNNCTAVYAVLSN